ncbi:Universal stress protein family protein [Fodinibius salinus]|uniref:Universal stress protein family protein n=1 Tax=Fodinibius salinus TaxID=860790 RepID=A0A5D3YM38_9BACT|nr:universal stress protein [Fodinibius salinus]TYP93741.1 Universal stress protein family protein [Fodinibius salinus]
MVSIEHSNGNNLFDIQTLEGNTFKAKLASLENRTHTDSDRYTIVIPISNPGSFKALLPPAIKACYRHNGVLLLLHVLGVSDQGKKIEEDRLDSAKTLLREGLRRVRAAGLEAKLLIRISNNIPDAVIHVAKEHQASLLVMGWGVKSEQNIMNTAAVDRIFANVEGNILIGEPHIQSTFRKVVVMVDELSLVEPVLEHASYLLHGRHQGIVLFHSFKGGPWETGINDYTHSLNKALRIFKQDNPGFEGEISLRHILETELESGALGNILKKQAQYADCVLLGTRNEYWVKKTFLVDRPNVITKALSNPIFLSRPGAPPKPLWMKRLFASLKQYWV